ncbi:MAG: nucleoside deaminase [Eubacterium sp.]|nr:nucleoside deaminase [Eubacterium sp.]
MEVQGRMQSYMKKAIAEAKKAAAVGEVPVGAVVVRGNEIIAAGHNMKETLQDPTAHAEIIALREAARILGSWRLSDCELYVTAEPCPMCMGAVLQCRLKALVYGTWESRYGAVETTAFLKAHPMLSNATEIYGGICEGECQAMLAAFFADARKKKGQ